MFFVEWLIELSGEWLPASSLFNVRINDTLLVVG